MKAKKRKRKRKNTQINKVLKFPSTNFLILKLLHDNFIINAVSYIFFQNFS